MRISIHRALAELKLIDSKLDKKIKAIDPIGVLQPDKLVNNCINTVVFEKNALESYQSIVDLIERKRLIKSAIVKANSETLVTVGDKSMSISDAITFKNTIDQRKYFVAILKDRLGVANKNLEHNNAQVEGNALRLAEAALQKDNVKIYEGDAVAITKPYLEKSLFGLVDPLNLSDKINALTDEIDTFEVEIDAVLSEINAITLIEI